MDLLFFSIANYKDQRDRSNVPPHVGKGALHCSSAKHSTTAFPRRKCPRWRQAKRNFCPLLTWLFGSSVMMRTLSGTPAIWHFASFWRGEYVSSRDLNSSISNLWSDILYFFKQNPTWIYYMYAQRSKTVPLYANVRNNTYYFFFIFSI